MNRERRFSNLIRWFLLPGSSGLTCPHCLATIGGIKNVCPNCRRILRFEGIEELRARSDQDSAS
jgi:predicted amidophosphoribosyltransferase